MSPSAPPSGKAGALKPALLGSWTLDLTSGSVTCSAELCELVGVEPQVGLPSLDRLLSLIDPADRGRCEDFDRRMRAGVGPIGEEVRMITPQGRERWVALRATPVADATDVAGPPMQMHCTVQDISESKAQEELYHLALHDRLTGLPNRNLFADRLDQAMSGRHGAVTVMVLDLDGFKAINDTLGHAAGDSLLVTVAGRLASALGPSDTVARLSGNEFSVLIEEVSDEITAAAAARLIVSLAPRVQLDGHNVSVRASIGIATAPTGSETSGELLRKADTAMCAAKDMGGARSEVFNPQMHGAVDEHLAVEHALRSVAMGPEMALHYQPLVDLSDGHLSGFEALLRWNHRTRGPVTPQEFIPIAEANGVIVPIGRWVLLEACRQLSAWHAEQPAAARMCMNVNVSARQLADAHLVEDVGRALELSSLDPALLTLEITESTMMADEEELGRRLGELKKLGLRIAVDDFGTRDSSMGRLERFPVDELKIDRSFVASLGRDGRQSGMAQSVLRLARDLHLEVVAEGIERVEQLADLRRVACTTGQGYYFAKPIAPEAIETLLRAGSHYPLPDSPTLVLLADADEPARASTASVLRDAGYEVVETGTGSDALQIARARRLDAVIIAAELSDMTGVQVAERLGVMPAGELPIFLVSRTAGPVDERMARLGRESRTNMTSVAQQDLVAALTASLPSHRTTRAPTWTENVRGSNVPVSR